MKEFWAGFWEGFREGAREAPYFYFEPVILGWRWLKRAAGRLGRGVARLARSGWRAIAR